MDIEVKRGKIDTEKCEVLALFFARNDRGGALAAESVYTEAIRRLFAMGDFTGAAEDALWLYPPEGNAQRLLVVGLGDTGKIDVESLQQAIARAVQATRKIGAGSICLALDDLPLRELSVDRKSQLVAEGLLLANYQFTRYKSASEVKEKALRGATILVSDDGDLRPAHDGVHRGKIMAQWTCFARDLQNTPANDLTPERLASIARGKAQSLKPAKGFRMACEIYHRKGIERLNMGALLGVARGSSNEPRFVVLEHKPLRTSGSARRPAGAVVLVGKGITFDTGGISIKPSEGLEEMKFDMSGAAAVLAAACAVAELGIPLHFVALLPCAENMPGGHAQRPGDIVRACNGKTIEVANTDAEGRLILADALAYAQRYKPAAVIDLATLTGAIFVALGGTAAGLFGTHARLLSRMKRAAETTGERVWELPLYEAFFDDVKSEVADIRNDSIKPSGGGACKGAAFLASFAEGYPWVHLDIAGVAHPKEDRPLTPKGGSGWGVRLLVQFCRDWLEQAD